MPVSVTTGDEQWHAGKSVAHKENYLLVHFIFRVFTVFGNLKSYRYMNNLCEKLICITCTKIARKFKACLFQSTILRGVSLSWPFNLQHWGTLHLKFILWSHYISYHSFFFLSFLFFCKLSLFCSAQLLRPVVGAQFQSVTTQAPPRGISLVCVFVPTGKDGFLSSRGSLVVAAFCICTN